MSDVLFIKFDDYSKVNHTDVLIKDVATVYSNNKSIEASCKQLRVVKLDIDSSGAVISSLKIIELIKSKHQNLDITPMGSVDFLVSYETKSKENKLLTFFKVAIVCIILFFGASFTIMTFNNDVSVSKLFSTLYENLTGLSSNNHTTLELGYSIGIPLGILIFYNHFGKRRITTDPTPIEIEMRLYENDINTTLIENITRKGENVDVDN